MDIVYVAMFTVGMSQIIKQLLEVRDKRMKAFMTLTVGIVGGLVLNFMPDWVFKMFLGLSLGTIIYDLIIKIFEKVFKGLEK